MDRWNTMNPDDELVWHPNSQVKQNTMEQPDLQGNGEQERNNSKTQYFLLIKSYWITCDLKELLLLGISPLSLKLGTMYGWVVSFMPQPVYCSGKNPQIIPNRPKNRSGRVKKNSISCHCRNRITIPRTSSPWPSHYTNYAIYLLVSEKKQPETNI
jgi:hypothetical protein